MLNTRIIFLLVCYLCCFIDANAQHNTNDGFDFIVTNDGVWTWYNDERAAFKNDKLYTSYVRKDGKVALSVNDIKTGANVGTEVVLSNWTQKDDHNNASILLRNDGKIMAFFSPHIREKNNYYRTSLVNEPTQQSDWSAQMSQITTNDSDNKGATYNNAFQLSAEGGKIYNFMRTNNFNPNFKEYTSNGAPIRDGADIILFKNGTGEVRPYVKYTSNNVDRIDFFFTDGHPRVADNSLYHCYYKTNIDGSQGSIYQTDGTLIATLQNAINGTPIDVSQVNKLYLFGSDGTTARAWTHSINYDSTGNPVVTYSKQKNISDITYHYAKWNGTQWNNYVVSDAGNGLYNGEDDYTGVITTNPYNTNEIFMSSNKNPISGIENNRYEIYSAITNDGGSAWNWTEVTKNSDKDNLRPFVPKGITNVNDRVLMWFHGTYTTYSNYQTRIVGEYINKIYTGPAPDLGEPIPPIETNITYGIDINSVTSPTLSPFKPLSGTANATVIDNGVTFTLFGTVTDSRDRGSATPNDLVRDFVYGSGNGTSTGVRIDGLPAGEYTLNSFHYDNDFSAPVSVILRVQGGAQIGDAIDITDERPATFNLTTEANTSYEIVATSSGPNGTRFNGLSIIDSSIVPADNNVLIDINTSTSNTKTGYTGMLGVNNTTLTTHNGSYLIFGFNSQPATNTNTDNLLLDFAQNSSTTASATPAIGFRLSGLVPGTYDVKSWHYDPTISGSKIKVQLREAGFGNPQTDLLTGIDLGSSNSIDYQITIETGKNYDLLFRADAGGLHSRFNGIEITPTSVLSTVDFQKKELKLFTVFPNPFNDIMNINIEKITNATRLKIYNSTGHLITEKNIENNSVKVATNNLSSGVYLLVLFNKQEIISTQKIIKK
ncbi:Por secretion system C-terminal sorting domain-containing protein [Lutibacter agarilyticus]|uniref:Por secretion system C-terminal sorting domain-containing protein n=1 Tax=Lutibacter agarilyticus TaxID=1109740 RepID=A0A238VA62_9FLAO|nr:BNR-4 repeat-containing protein [Lutibacter agarilyticus]SNR31081.1 Por secretion system C-terminal sorting domain-containing protein [Lutibacter agarilyticus]